jgi:hypothetical protein
MHANTHVYTCRHIFLGHSGRNSGKDGGCDLALDSATYQTSCQATRIGTGHRISLTIDKRLINAVFNVVSIKTT